jgi:hypothetical protein
VHLPSRHHETASTTDCGLGFAVVPCPLWRNAARGVRVVRPDGGKDSSVTGEGLCEQFEFWRGPEARRFVVYFTEAHTSPTFQPNREELVSISYLADGAGGERDDVECVEQLLDGQPERSLHRRCRKRLHPHEMLAGAASISAANTLPRRYTATACRPALTRSSRTSANPDVEA